MKRRSAQSATALTSIIVASLTLASCGGATGSDSENATSSTTETAAVSTHPDAPALSDREGAFNFIRTDDDGSTTVLGHVVVLSDGTWFGIAEEKSQFTELKVGNYKVVARGSSGCSGAGTTSDVGLGVIGEIHVEKQGSADVWSTPVKLDADYFSTVTLVDEADKVIACAKRVSWTAPTTTSTESTS